MMQCNEMTMNLKCPLCNSKKILLYHSKVWNTPDKRVFRCDDCRITFIHPMMTQQEEYEFYSHYNSHVKKRGLTVTNEPSELHAKSRPVAKERWDIIKHYFVKGSRVLEVGCATGAFLEIFSQQCICVCGAG